MQSAQNRRTAATVSTALAVVVMGQALLSVVVRNAGGGRWRAWAESNSAVGVLAAWAFAAVAVPVIRHQPRSSLGWVFLAVAELNAVGALATELISDDVAAGRRSVGVTIGTAIGANAWWVGLLVLLSTVPWLFPRGRLPARPWRSVVVCALAATGVLAAVAVASGELVVDRFPTTRSAVATPVPRAVAVGAGTAAYLLALSTGLIGTARLTLQLRRARGRRRSQLSWFVVACLVVAVLPHVPPAPWSTLVAVGLFPVCLGVAILRHGSFGGDRLLSQTLVYAVLTGSVLSVLAIGARVLGGELAGSTGGLALAALVLAFCSTPLHRLVSRLVDRALHAPPRDPYLALRTVSTRLGSPPARGEPLEAVADAVARSLGVLRVLIVATPPAEADGSLVVPLHFAGERVGTLVVQLRPEQPRLSSLDHALLDDMAELVAVAVRTTTLLAEARSLRETSLFALEEERRRLRSDLHDGLGPALAGVALSLSALADSTELRGSATGVVLERLHTQTRSCLDDVQHIVHGLRPSALDGLGLIGALGEHAQSLTEASATTFSVQLDDSRHRDPLPAAVELAAYRVAMEAMTNVAVHAQASWCRVRLEVGPERLRVTVHDDGIGVGPDAARHGGLGLRTMQRRAADLGGRTTLTSVPGSTTVCLDVPIAAVP